MPPVRKRAGLPRVVLGQEPEAGGLAGDHAVGPAVGDGVARADTDGGQAAVGVGDDDVAGGVDGGVVEVEQVAAVAGRAAALQPDAALLHRVVLGDIDRLPRGPAV